MTLTQLLSQRYGTLCVRTLLVLSLVGTLALSVAEAAYIGSDLVIVTMSDNQGRSASKGIPNPLANVPDHAPVPDFVRDMLTERFNLTDGDTVLGSVDALAVELIGDPVASLSFAVTAGSSDVTISIATATVSFPALSNPPASAEAEITLSDNNNNSAASIETVSGNSGLYRAIYNGSSQYAALLGDSSVGGGSVTFSENTSGPIAGSVSSIQSRFDFKLSAGDSASGMGKFTVVIPEPGTIGLLACGCVALSAATLRRRPG